MTSARRFAFLLPCLFAADAAPVSPVSTFCATGLDTVVVNNVTQSQFGPYKICMSVDELVWRQELEGVTTLYNASREYTLGTDAAGSVVNCTVRTVDPYTAVDMPFSFVLVDDEAAVSGQVSIDGVTADDWLHYRPVHATGPVHFPDEYMHWYVAVDDARELRTDCVQYYDNTPGDGGNSTVSHGMRDYSRDFDAAAGADWALYAPPDGVTCTDVTGSAAEPRPVSWTSSRWGGF